MKALVNIFYLPDFNCKFLNGKSNLIFRLMTKMRTSVGRLSIQNDAGTSKRFDPRAVIL